jgi:hypothetical protein
MTPKVFASEAATSTTSPKKKLPRRFVQRQLPLHGSIYSFYLDESGNFSQSSTA